MFDKFKLALALTVAALPANGALAATCIGNCGTSGADGVVTAPPGGSSYQWISTYNGASGAGQLPGIGGTNGSSYSTGVFSAASGDQLKFFFNYVTSDGAGYADYAWARLTTDTGDLVATLFTARTQSSGTIAPGFGLPGVEATLNPSSVPIIGGGPAWSPLGGSSGSCFALGCGYTGWIDSSYTIGATGNYVLTFGVTNWSDQSYHSGMAFSGLSVGGEPIGGVPEPATWATMITGFGLVGMALRRRRREALA